ncbi:hypothetical protein C0J56_05100 [Pseudomonas fluorescens]|nr:hypothetical protein C0J56_05100 [Pseudomonas fluorescens]
MDALPFPCGSEPARDSGGSVTDDVDCAAVIASRLAPTVVRVFFRVAVVSVATSASAAGRWHCADRSARVGPGH